MPPFVDDDPDRLEPEVVAAICATQRERTVNYVRVYCGPLIGELFDKILPHEVWKDGDAWKDGGHPSARCVTTLSLCPMFVKYISAWRMMPDRSFSLTFHKEVRGKIVEVEEEGFKAARVCVTHLPCLRQTLWAAHP